MFYIEPPDGVCSATWLDDEEETGKVKVPNYE